MRRDFSNLSDEEAGEILKDAFTVLFARYKISSSFVDILTLNKEGTSRSRIQVKAKFSLNGFINKEDIL